jgi:rootletin
MQTEEKELQARLATEIEERERAQQELHQLKKQASYSVSQVTV